MKKRKSFTAGSQPSDTEYEILDRYWLTPPYAYANIYRDGYDNVHYQW